MAFAPIRRQRLSLPNGDGIDWSNPHTIKFVAAFNFSDGEAPVNLISGRNGTWSHSGTKPTKRITPLGIGLSNGASASSYSTYGSARLFDGFSPANSPACFVFSFCGGTYVSNGSSLNIIWCYGAADAGVGFYAQVNSSSVLGVRLGNTFLSGPTITSSGKYVCVAGRDGAGNCWLFVNGVLVATGTGATSADSSVPSILYVNGDSTGSRAFSGAINLLCIGSHSPATTGVALSSNPWQVFL